MNRFKSIPNPFRSNVIVDYTPSQQHDDSRIVDDSHYVPNRRANQILAKQFASQVTKQVGHYGHHAHSNAKIVSVEAT